MLQCLLVSDYIRQGVMNSQDHMTTLLTDALNSEKKNQNSILF